jgi:hypothetical protein
MPTPDLGLYEWSGLNPIPPEGWLLPYTVKFPNMFPNILTFFGKINPFSAFFGEKNCGSSQTNSGTQSSSIWNRISQYWESYWDFPFHPGRFWCHCRMVYLPMSYLYGIRARCHETLLIKELREELYVGPYDEIAWESHRFHCGETDQHIAKASWGQRFSEGT